MNNPKIEVDIAEIFGEIKQELKAINNRLNNLEISQVENLSKLNLGQEEIKGNIKAIEVEQANIQTQLTEIKGSQKAQLWSLIVILATAVLGVLAALAKVFLSS